MSMAGKHRARIWRAVVAAVPPTILAAAVLIHTLTGH